MFKNLMKKNLTKTLISGVAFPPGSDLYIVCDVSPIAQASDLRRSVNGDLINLARSPFKKYRVSLTCADIRPAAIDHLFPGDYLEVVPSEPFHFSFHPPATSVQIPRSCIEIVGMTAAGDLVQPNVQPVSSLPLSKVYDPVRVAAMRANRTVNFPVAVESVRFRPVLACRLLSSSHDSVEFKSTSSWKLELEEV